MAKAWALSLLLLFLALPIASLAERQRYRRQRTEQSCSKLEALEPTRRIESEAGRSEFWDHNNQQFQCAGVSAARHTIEPRGLLLPSSSNSPRLVYVVEGQGIGGLVIPGCPESYSSSEENPLRQMPSRRHGRYGDERSLRGEDQHQKVHRLRKGDIIAVPAGVPVWSYNNGERPLIVVSVLDTGNYINQLDNTPRRFFLGGIFSQQRGSESRRRGEREEEQSFGNIFDGFDTELIAEALGISRETASKLQSREERRRRERKGMIVRVEEGLQTIRPREYEEEEERRERRGSSESEEEQERRRERSGERRRSNERGRRGEREREEERRRGSSESRRIGFLNGIEEQTVCNLKFKLNIGNPRHSDVYIPEAGRLTTLNSFKLPLLEYIQLGADVGLLRRNAIMGPKWNTNSHSVKYVIRGSARVQIVDSDGNSVMDERVNEGQMFVVPQNFVEVTRAEDQEEYEWVSFHTTDYSITNHLAGKGSTLAGIPLDVLANSFHISREEARHLKQTRTRDLALFLPRSSTRQTRAVA